MTEIPKGVYGRAGTKKLKCVQVLCTLSDDITPTYMQIGGNGQPLESCIRQVLACQQTARWKLGRCDFATLYEYSFASEGLLSALLKLIEPIPDALITTDTTSYPWTLNVVRADDTDATELRYSRNMEEISEEVLDTDFATRLYPLGYGEGVNQLNIKSVNGGTAYIDSPTQALWGVVSKPYVDTTITDAATLLAQGRAALELCCNPHVSYGVTCKDISILTGEPLDAFYTGRMARIIYRDYGLTIRARVREIHYPKPITEPWNAKLTIANRSADVASVIAQLQRTSRIEQLYGQGSTTFYSGGIEQNADKDTPAEGDIYIPDDMVHINAIMLKVTLSAFRADSKGAKGGGGTVTTTRASGGGTQTSEAGGGATLTVEKRTVSEVKMTGMPMQEQAVNANTGFAKNFDGDNMSDTGAASGETGSGGGCDTGISRDENGPKLKTEAAEGSTGEGGGGNTGISRNEDGAMTETGDAGQHSHGSNNTHRHTFDGVSVGKTGYTSYNGAGGTTSTGEHSHGMSHWHSVDGHTHSLGGHSHAMTHWHTIDPHTHSLGNHTHDMTHRHEFQHYHQMNISLMVPSQVLYLDAHRHTVSIPAHTHEVNVPEHVHGIEYGMYSGPTAEEYIVEVDGKELPTDTFTGGVGDIAPIFRRAATEKSDAEHFIHLPVRLREKRQ
ncbi:MAG: phage tail spike protein [Christensenellales bacterium]